MLVHQNDDPPQLKRRRSQFCKVQYEKLKRIAFFQSISFHFFSSLPSFSSYYASVLCSQNWTIFWMLKLHQEWCSFYCRKNTFSVLREKNSGKKLMCDDLILQPFFIQLGQTFSCCINPLPDAITFCVYLLSHQFHFLLS